MRAIITGGTGLIGRALIAILMQHAHEVIVLSRDPGAATRQFTRYGWRDIQVLGWDACTANGWGHLITPESAVINLAGATPVHWRWTTTYRGHIMVSRLCAGGAVMQAMERYGPPAVLLQASASGFYGDRGQEILTESSAPGRGFRAEVCQRWEAATAHTNTRRCILRTGIVLDGDAGAFPSLRRFAQLWGNRLGTGRQWIPWIYREDVARAMLFLIEHQTLSGPFNVCAPEPATQHDFIHAVQRIIQRPALISLPTLALRLALGEMASVVLDSQHLLPYRLLEQGFSFDLPQLDQALRHLI
jgi:uncharacterized protein